MDTAYHLCNFLSMKKKCPPPSVGGPPNPSIPLPAQSLQAKGHTAGKASQLPGKLTKAVGKSASHSAVSSHVTGHITCLYKPGQRKTPNPQRGRPAFASQIIQPVKRNYFVMTAQIVPGGGNNFFAVQFQKDLTGVLPCITYFWSNPNFSLVWEAFSIYGAPDFYVAPLIPVWNCTEERSHIGGEWFNRIGKHTLAVPPATSIYHGTEGNSQFGVIGQ